MNNIIATYQKNLSRIVKDDNIHDDVAKLFKFLKGPSAGLCFSHLNK